MFLFPSLLFAVQMFCLTPKFKLNIILNKAGELHFNSICSKCYECIQNILLK